MNSRAVIAIACAFLIFAKLSPGADMSPELTALVHDVMQPYAGSPPAGGPPAAVKAAELLKRGHLFGSGRPALPRNNLIEQYGKALALGTRAPQFAADIALIHQAFRRGDEKGVRDAIRALIKRAGRSEPGNEDLNRMVEELRKLESAGAPVERIVFEQPDHSAEISWFKDDGTVKVEVTDKAGPGGKPTRTVFEGSAETKAGADGRSLELKGKPVEKPARQVTEDSSKALREKINGKWTDQNGLVWELSGNGSVVVATQLLASGHKIPYQSDYKLGKISGAHSVNDARDVTNDLPEGVKQQLAASYHPVYKIRLDVNDAADRMEGTWISQHVTYSGLDGSISKIGDPFDSRLILSRAVTSGTALGMKDGDFP